VKIYTQNRSHGEMRLSNDYRSVVLELTKIN
jgi:hypothetical protein